MPYSHAADATMNIPFDSEKEVYTAMFEELTAAIEELTEKAENGVNVMGAYDAVYAGDATMGEIWQFADASFGYACPLR